MFKTKDTGDNPGNGKTNNLLRLDGQSLWAFKVRAIEEVTSVQRNVEPLVDEYLERRGRVTRNAKNR